MPKDQVSGAPSALSRRFGLGVASGEPSATSVMLWTRLLRASDEGPESSDAEGLDTGSDQTVTVEVATDPDFEHLVAVSDAIAEVRYGHSIHALIEGLDAATFYYYRFYDESGTSPVGRTKTLPTGDGPFTLALTTCQDPQSGLYAAWAEIAAIELDAVLFTGDYIYEFAPSDGTPDQSGGRQWTNDPPQDLDGFRKRYEFVKSDDALRAAHGQHPFFLMWDDHEVSDNYWADGPGQLNVGTGDFHARRTAAYQAWWEHQPVAFAPPEEDDLTVYRTIHIGELADLLLLDGRQYADVPPCRDTSVIDVGAQCVEGEEARSILGGRQHEWLLGELGSSQARWTCLVSPVLFSGLDASPPGSDAGASPVRYLETWDGYPQERLSVFDALAAQERPVVLSGDFHASFVLDVGPGFDREAIASEIVCTGISSGPSRADYRPMNPHVQHYRQDNGYTICSVATGEIDVEFRSVKDIWDPKSSLETTARFTIPAEGDGLAVRAE